MRKEKYGASPAEQKYCCRIKCAQKNPQPFSAFSRDKRHVDGMQGMCKACFKLYREVNLDKECTYYREFAARIMYRQARTRAKKYGREFSITENDIQALIDNTNTCAVLGVPLIYGGKRGRNRSDSASLDRIDSAEGYSKNNVRIISFRANTLRNNATLREQLLLAIDAVCRLPDSDVLESMLLDALTDLT